MENKTDKPYSLQDAKDEAAKLIGEWLDWDEFSKHYELKSAVDYMINTSLRIYKERATEDLRKERDHIFEQALTQRRKVIELESEIERLKESNKQLEEASDELLTEFIQKLLLRTSIEELKKEFTIKRKES